MGDKLHEPEFWLPSEFLTDKDILMDIKANVLKSSSGLRFPDDFPYDFGSSVLSSPVESVLGSTETESDEEDLLLTELTRQLTLHETHKLIPTQQNHEKARVLSGSPQSTLAQVGSWSGRSTMSGNGSPNGPSQVSSPPTTPLGVNNDAWDLIYQAASQVARIKMNGGAVGRIRNPGLVGPPIPLSTSPHLRNSYQLKQEAGGLWSRQVKNGWSYDTQEFLQNIGGRIGGVGYGSTMGTGMGQASCAWPSQHYMVGELGMKTGGQRVYSGCGYGYGSVGGLKKERAGTGVFLPRRYENSSSNATISSKTLDTLKRTGCSSAWVPSKVAQVSNMSFDHMNGIGQQKSSQYDAGFFRDFDALVARRNALLAQQRRSLCPDGSIISHEICLPQEWTY